MVLGVVAYRITPMALLAKDCSPVDWALAVIFCRVEFFTLVILIFLANAHVFQRILHLLTVPRHDIKCPCATGRADRRDLVGAHTSFSLEADVGTLSATISSESFRSFLFAGCGGSCESRTGIALAYLLSYLLSVTLHLLTTICVLCFA